MSHLADRPPRPKTSRAGGYYARLGALLSVVTVGGLVACGSDSGHAKDTLPPIATTTTTTTMPPTTTTIPDSYVIMPGDSLSAIAKMFGLTTQQLALFNGITNPQHIESGQTLKIPDAADLASTTTITPPPPGSDVATTIAP